MIPLTVPRFLSSHCSAPLSGIISTVLARTEHTCIDSGTYLARSEAKKTYFTLMGPRPSRERKKARRYLGNGSWADVSPPTTPGAPSVNATPYTSPKSLSNTPLPETKQVRPRLDETPPLVNIDPTTCVRESPSQSPPNTLVPPTTYVNPSAVLLEDIPPALQHSFDAEPPNHTILETRAAWIQSAREDYDCLTVSKTQERARKNLGKRTDMAPRRKENSASRGLGFPTAQPAAFPTRYLAQSQAERVEDRYGLELLINNRAGMNERKRQSSLRLLEKMWNCEAFPEDMSERERQWYGHVKTKFGGFCVQSNEVGYCTLLPR
jgi:hypothetical protein